MKILKTSLMKKEFINNEKNPFEMKLINKIKTTKNVLKNEINIIKISFKETKCQRSYICETKYN